jgi:hypothetical protein
MGGESTISGNRNWRLSPLAHTTDGYFLLLTFLLLTAYGFLLTTDDSRDYALLRNNLRTSFVQDPPRIPAANALLAFFCVD